MELLLSIWQSEKDELAGISTYVCAVSTSPQTDSAMHLFIREMIGLGCFIVTNGPKASKKHLLLCNQLRGEAENYFTILALATETVIANIPHSAATQVQRPT